MPYNTTAIPPRKEPTGHAQLPLSRIKRIVAQDEDIAICSNNAAFVLTLAAELFIQHLAEESHTQAKVDTKPRRNIQYKDVANAVARQDNLEFLEDVVPKTVPYKNVKASIRSAPARLADGKKPSGESSTPKSKPPTNGATAPAAGVAVNGNSPTNDLILSPASRGAPRAPAPAPVDGDPSEQLELEMRQAQGGSSRDEDVHMTG